MPCYDPDAYDLLRSADSPLASNVEHLNSTLTEMARAVNSLTNKLCITMKLIDRKAPNIIPELPSHVKSWWKNHKQFDDSKNWK